MSKIDIRIGNALDVLRGMDSESIDVVVTFPPYWALRDYGSEPVVWGGKSDCEHCFDNDVYCSKCGQWKGQLGLEPDPRDYIEHLCSIFDEVYRVLKPTGALWVNLGDTYGTVSGCGFDRWRNNDTQKSSLEQNELKKKSTFVRDKCLVQIPSRFAIAMTDRGWILRNECIWHKPNQMPISVKDRFTVDFEKFFFFVKEPRYYFKQQLEPIKNESIQRQHRQKCNNGKNGVIMGTNAYKMNTSKWGDDGKESSVRQGMNQNRGSSIIEKRYNLPDKTMFISFLKSRTSAKQIIVNTDIELTTAEHWFRQDCGFSYPTVQDWNKIKNALDDGSDDFKQIDFGLTDITYETDDIMKNNNGNRNMRTTWDINLKGSGEQHVQMFPSELVDTPIKACCPPGGVVLDPFCGSGTTLEYCKLHNIDAIGIEINPKFEDMIKRRQRASQKGLDDFITFAESD